MIDKLGAYASSRSSFFNKCFMAALVTVLLAVGALFLFFAIMRQSHPSDTPAQKTERVTQMPLLTA